MSIAIDKKVCVGCGRRADICPGTLLALRDNRAYIRYPDECWGCVCCVKACPVHAISLYLGADIGGMGSRMTVRRDGDLLYWTVTRPDKTQETITVNSRDANQY